MLARLMIEESGQGMAEYALILAFIALACITAFSSLGKTIEAKITAVKI